MGSTIFYSQLSDALFTKTQQAVLGLLFTNPDTSYHFRGIVRKVGIGQGTIQRELQRLTEAGIILRELRDLQPVYRANKDCPIFTELRSLVAKTMGVSIALRDALKTFGDQIQVAFIFGSFARGGENVKSDVDVLIIGDISMRDLVGVLNSVQDSLNRELNPIVYPADEYRARLKGGNHFLTSLQSEAKIFLIGTSNELDRLGQE
ncbi:MAG TPA: nucleotidyltransferase domain-containing protein [bacterium]|jgi:predicted nucleotidyltransferase/DNA-binding HxlR family transcriptional regulator